MVTQEFERFLFEIFANPRDGFATNQELSNMEMTARSFEKHVFCFASMKSQQIGWKPFTRLDNPHVKVGNVEKEWKDPVCRTRIWAIEYGLFGPFMICICVNSLNSTYLIVIHTKSY